MILFGLLYLFLFKKDETGSTDKPENNTAAENNITAENNTATENDTTGNNADNLYDKTETTGNGETTGNESSLHVNFDGFTISDSIKNLNTETIHIGYNRDSCERDECNRPVFLDNIQNQYGEKYNASFIGEKNSKKIYLTFTMGYEYYNDGVANTDRIMEILKEKNVPAMFFVDGGYVRNNPEMCKKIVENGFILGCHGYDHPSITIMM